MMTIKPRYQKLFLLLHISLSVAWFGGAIVYLIIAILGAQGQNVSAMHSAYGLLESIGWYVLIPLGAAALATGIIQSLVTRWGLLDRWWVVLKLVLTTVAFGILLNHMMDVSHSITRAAITASSFTPEIVHALGGIAVLFHTIAFSVYKPFGLTAYGRRRFSISSAGQSFHRKHWPQLIGFHAAAIAVLFLVLHVTGMHGGMHH